MGVQVQTLTDPSMAGFYIGSPCLLGAHIWSGWSNTVHKFDVTAAERHGVSSFGQSLIAAITVGFVAVALAAHLKGVQ